MAVPFRPDRVKLTRPPNLTYRTMRLSVIGLFGLSLLLTACGGGGGNSAAPSPSDSQSGLDQRPANSSCLAPPLPTIDTEVGLERAWPNLPLSQPLKLLQAPNDDARWYVVQKSGEILWFNGADETTSILNRYLDYSASSMSPTKVDASGEGGMLGMAFHPLFSRIGFVYISYTVTGPNQQTPLVSRITRLTRNDDGNTLNPASEGLTLSVDQPFSNHNGGNIEFGPDRSLYIGLGDGGSGGDPNADGQNTNTLLGAMLRIDVDNGLPYVIPPDNPFANGGGRAEIFAWGLRNPWRWSFDRLTGRLWAGDVGQGAFEEIDVIENGNNYGWRCFEGEADFNLSNCGDRSLYTFPVAAYGRNEGNSVTGGYVYRGNNIPGLQGVYVFGDFGSGTIWGLFPLGGDQYERRPLIQTSLGIASFGQGNDGELYVVDINGGGLYRLVQRSAGTPSGGPPTNLSQTGCVDPDNPAVPATGLIPYDVNEPFSSDGGEKERFIALPDNTSIEVDAHGDMTLPANSVLLKHFRLGGQLIETRLFVRHIDGSWAGYSYEWNDSLTDAVLLEDGKDKTIGNQVWRYPSRAECTKCHTLGAGFSLGVETLQLNGAFRYPSTGRTANQLDTWRHIGLLTEPLPATFKDDALTPTDNSANAVDLRARSFLHVNCSGCHRPGGNTPAQRDLRFHTPLADANICNATPTLGDLGIADARLLAPGAPGSSILIARAGADGPNRMPPIANNVVDGNAVALLTEWISTGAGCP
ncbi:MAG: PQQ-dependent sugar dehydrogenase [Gammaproteobacteria bacterium]